MITNTKQSWTKGQSVKVGFMTLEVVGDISSSHYMPDAYLLKSSKGVFYSFTPYNGLSKLDSQESFYKN